MQESTQTPEFRDFKGEEGFSWTEPSARLKTDHRKT